MRPVENVFGSLVIFCFLYSVQNKISINQILIQISNVLNKLTINNNDFLIILIEQQVEFGKFYTNIKISNCK